MKFALRLSLSLIVALATGTSSWAAEPDQAKATWVEINKTIYGAKPNRLGPIGGAKGYANIITKGDYQAWNQVTLLDALSRAKAGEVVFIPGEREIDLTARIYIEQLVLEVPEGVTLAGDRGHNGSKGALLISDVLNTPVMIRAAGPNVRITGLRIRGPHPRRYMEHAYRSFNDKAKGPGYKGRGYYYKFPQSNGIVTKHPRLEVDNCEISAFAHAGIYLMKGEGHHIHHNFIHHCQLQALGYGVSHLAASSLIEYNVFNWNRHSIAGTGQPGCSYVARHNVESGVSLSHCFDMHGGKDRRDGTNIAGTSIEIYNNTFRAPQVAVYFRGEQQEKGEIHHNWFTKHGSTAQAVKESETAKIYNNIYADRTSFLNAFISLSNFELIDKEIGNKAVLQLLLRNRTDHKMTYDLKWRQLTDWGNDPVLETGFVAPRKEKVRPLTDWGIDPVLETGFVAPGKEKVLTFTLKRNNMDTYIPPVCNTQISVGNTINEVARLRIAPSLFREVFRPVVKVVHTEDVSPKIDGVLNETVWSKSDKIGTFTTQYGKEISADTFAFLAYDKDNLYVAVQCFEPEMKGIRNKAKEHDGPVWADDSIEIFLDTNKDRKTYYQLIVNSLGIVYDARVHDKSFELNPLVATSHDEKSWMVEVAIPWTNLKVKRPESLTAWGFALVRNRTKDSETQQLPPLFGGNHQPKMFGDLVFGVMKSRQK